MLRFATWVFFAFLALLWDLALGRKPAPQVEAPPPDRFAGINPESRKEGHDVADAWPRVLACLVAGLFTTIVLVMMAVHFMEGPIGFQHNAVSATLYEQSFRSAPYSHTSIGRDWEKIDEETKERLESYRWVDRAKGVAAIPIERAMEQVAAEGLPARKEAPPDFAAPGHEMKALLNTENVKNVTKSL